MYPAKMKYVFIKQEILQRWEICLSGGRGNWIHPALTKYVMPTCLKWCMGKAFPFFVCVIACLHVMNLCCFSSFMFSGVFFLKPLINILGIFRNIILTQDPQYELLHSEPGESSHSVNWWWTNFYLLGLTGGSFLFYPFLAFILCLLQCLVYSMNSWCIVWT